MGVVFYIILFICIPLPVIIIWGIFILLFRYFCMRNIDTRNRFIHNQVMKYIKAKRFEKASVFIDKYIKKYPHDFFLYNEKGYLLIYSTKFDESITYFIEAYKLNSNDTASLINLSWVYNELRNYEEAVICSEKAIKSNKSNITAYITKGDALLGLKKYKEAYDSFDSAIEISRYYAYAYLGFGIACFNLEKYSEAIKSFKQYLDFIPDDFDAMAYLSFCYNHTENYMEQIEILDKIIELNDDIPWVHCAKGNALCFVGEVEKAINCFNKAIELNNNYAQAHYLKSRILSLSRQGEEAMKSLKMAIELDENYKQEALEDEALNNIKVFREFRNIIF